MEIRTPLHFPLPGHPLFSMNIAFVCHGNATSQSTYHVLSIAEKLSVAGHQCIVCIPTHSKGDLSRIRPTSVPVMDFAQVEGAGLQFPDGQGPTLIHCWTPREEVRKFVDRLLRRYHCPYFVHLEDNEREILARELQDITYEALVRLPPDDQDRHIANQHIRIHPTRHWEFLKGAAGCTVLIERLKEHVPTGVPVQLFWPGHDDSLVVAPDKSPAQLRSQYGIAGDRFVVLYAGAIHGINYDEICRMVTALKILVNRGMPLTLVKTGHNEFPDLLRHGVARGWIKELGFLDRDRLHEVYRLADVLIQPGRSDPFNEYRFPSKLPEALALKVPVILPRCNLGRELQDGVEALVTEDDSMERLIEKVLYLYENPGQRARIGSTGWQFGQQHLSWDKAARTIASFYEACLAGPEVLARSGLVQSQQTDYSTTSSLPERDRTERRLQGPIAPEDLYQLFIEERGFKGRGTVLADGKSVRNVALSPLLYKAQRKVRKYRLLYTVELVIIVGLLVTLYVHG